MHRLVFAQVSNEFRKFQLKSVLFWAKTYKNEKEEKEKS
jgi:hypothetical protein